MRTFLIGCVMTLMVITMGCGAGEKEEQQQISEKVKQLEKSEYQLLYFQIDYQTYQQQVDDIVHENYLDLIRDRVIFGYSGNEYTSKELIDMQRDEWETHKNYMLRITEQIGLHEQQVTIQLSGVYPSDQKTKMYLYTSELKELKEKPMTKTNKRYTVEFIDNQWLITGVEQDKFTFGSERTTEEIQSEIEKLDFHTHEGQPVEYNDEMLKLEGVG